MGRTLPPGFRFHPTDAELLKFYLKRKLMKKNLPCEVISELDIYKYAPWDLPDKSHLRSRDLNWYFFCPRDKKYSSGARFNRATEFGHWKATGKDRSVNCNDEVVGFIKTLIFHRGRAPKGERTDWVMHEYRLEDRALVNTGIPQDAYVLCKIFEKDGPGPRNSIQYGAPFNEEEWDGKEEVEAISIEASPSPVLFAPSPLPQSNDQQGSTASSSNLAPPEVPTVNTATPMEIFAPADDGIPSLLCIFGEEDCLWLLNRGSTATQGNSFEFSQTVPQIDPEFVASSSNLSPPEVPVVNSTTPMESFSPADDGILSLLCIFRDEECPLLLNGGSTATQGNSYEFGQTVPQTDPEIVASSSNVAPPKVPVVNSATPMEIFAPTDDGILSLLCFFREEDCPLLLNGGSTATRGNCFEFSQTVPDIDPGEDEIVSLLTSFRGEEE